MARWPGDLVQVICPSPPVKKKRRKKISLKVAELEPTGKPQRNKTEVFELMNFIGVQKSYNDKMQELSNP